MTIRIWGARYDLVEVEGITGADDFNVYSTSENMVMWEADLIAPGGDSMHVMAILTDRMVWGIGIAQADESIPLPNWPIRIIQHPETAYATMLEIDAPDGTRIDNIRPVKENTE